MIRRLLRMLPAITIAACSSFGEASGPTTDDSGAADAADAGTADADTVDAVVDAGPPRVTNGLVALYGFRDGAGKVVADGTPAPVDLSIQDATRATWSADGLALNGTHARTSGAAGKVVGCKSAGEITFEAWVKAQPAEQSGPARIISLANDPVDDKRLFLLGLGRNGDGVTKTSSYVLRFGTGTAVKLFETPEGTATGTMQHLVATAKPPGEAVLYVDGVIYPAFTMSDGFSGWSDRVLSIGDDITPGNDHIERSFTGTYALLAVYCRALTIEEVLVNLAAGPRP